MSRTPRRPKHSRPQPLRAAGGVRPAQFLDALHLGYILAMEPPPPVKSYDPGLSRQGERVVEEEIRSESGLGAGPEAREEGKEEKDLGPMEDVNRKGHRAGDIGLEGDIGHAGDRDHEAPGTHAGHEIHAGAAGDREPGQQLAGVGHVVAAAAPGTESGAFTPAQVRELEIIYQHTQDPDWFTR